MYDLMFGGYGARAGHDGAEALSPVVNCANIPVEVHETINPVLVRRFELIADTGGAGRWRGGCGIRKDIELRSDKALMTLLGERHSHTGYCALFGGKPGSLAETILEPGGEAWRMGSKDVRPLNEGDVVSFRLNGGGGYGGRARARPQARSRRTWPTATSRAAAAQRIYGWRGYRSSWAPSQTWWLGRLAASAPCAPQTKVRLDAFFQRGGRTLALATGIAALSGAPAN